MSYACMRVCFQSNMQLRNTEVLYQLVLYPNIIYMHNNISCINCQNFTLATTACVFKLPIATS